MKKIISVMLAMLLAFSSLAVLAAAEGGDYQTHYISYDITEDTLHIVPVDGYSQYVVPGEDFKFTVEVDEGYSDAFVIVQIDTVELNPDVHGVYTIEEVTEDMTIRAFLSMDDDATNLFGSLIVMLQQMFQAFVDWLNMLFKSEMT